MKLPRSALLSFCLAAGSSLPSSSLVSAFHLHLAPLPSSSSLSSQLLSLSSSSSSSSVVRQEPRRRRRQCESASSPGGQTTTTTSTSTSLGMVGIHEPSASAAADENFVRKEMSFRQVLREVGEARDYLDWLVVESSSSSSVDAKADDAEGGAAAEAAPVAGAASDVVVELLGGGAPAPPAGDSTPPATVYGPSLRSDLGSSVLLSGFTDLHPALLSVLNNNFFGAESVPNFDFKLIRALVPDVGAAKKRAIGREARYGGLLDKLVVEPCTGELPSPAELGGASSWIVQVPSASDAESVLQRVASLARDSASLKNVVVVVVGTATAAAVGTHDDTSTMAGVKAGWEAVVEASGGGDAFRCTMLAVDGIYDGGDGGGYYHVDPLFGEDAVDRNPPSSSSSSSTPRKISAKLAYRLLAHSLALDCTSGQALAAFEYATDEVESLSMPIGEGEFAIRDDATGEEVPDAYGDVKTMGRLLQAMRGAGFTPVMELDVLVGKGLAAYKEYLANPPDKKNAFGGTSSSGIARVKSARDEQDEKIMAILEEESAKRRAAEDAKAAEKREVDVEGIAKEWATKEYTLRMLNGDIDDSLSEKDFLVSVWDQALAEGAKAYDYINSGEYELEKGRKQKAMVDVEDRLFWDGMPPLMRKKREKMVERVKKQYMDLLSEEELERIILTSE